MARQRADLDLVAFLLAVAGTIAAAAATATTTGVIWKTPMRGIEGGPSGATITGIITAAAAIAITTWLAAVLATMRARVGLVGVVATIAMRPGRPSVTTAAGAT